MKLARPIIYANIASLAVNAVLVGLTLVRSFPALVAIAVVFAGLSAAVWCSCFIQGKLPRRRRA